MTAKGVVCALVDRVLDAEFAAALAAQNEWTLVRRCVDLAETRAVARAGTAAVAVISAEHRALDARAIDDLRASGLRLVGVAQDEAAERRLHQWRVDVVVSGRVDAATLVAALDDALATVSDAEASAPPSAQPQGAGRLVVVWGPPGAPGRSTLAWNLAAEWAAEGVGTLLVDADDRVGSLAQFAGVLDDQAGLLAAARAANQAGLDVPALARLAPQLDDRLRLLTGVARSLRTPPAPTAMEQVWEVCRLVADVVVVDAGAADTDGLGLGASALAAADQVVVVGLPDPIGLARLVTAVQDLREAGTVAELHCVLNRVRRSEFGRSGLRGAGLRGTGPSGSGLARSLSRWVATETVWRIPEDVAAADRALATGRSIRSVDPRSPMRQGIRNLRTGLAVQKPSRASRSRADLAIG